MIETRYISEPQYTTSEFEASQALKQKVFRSGNLIHSTGRATGSWSSFFTEGIKTGAAVGTTRDFICFGILGDEEIDERYQNASHYGPRYDTDTDSIAFVLDLVKLQAEFPRQLFAVGKNFKPPFLRRSSKGSFGIPFRNQRGHTVLPAEVRLFPKKFSRTPLVVSPSIYLAMIASPSYFSTLEPMSEQGLPVFSPSCEFIGTIGLFGNV